MSVEPESLSEKGSDPLRRGQSPHEIDSPPKGQTPFRIGSESEPDLSGPDSPHFSLPPIQEAGAQPIAWQEVADGRFMPLRVRGSCHGRALG
jgi:hypothetical protein